MKKSAFTLAEVLITLAIIGVVAALTIPSVVANTQQKEFQTGLRKAVSVLNSAITMNMAIDGESPYENKDTFSYLQRHMSIMKSTSMTPYVFAYRNVKGSLQARGYNAAFYTTDGMRFEVEDTCGGVTCGVDTPLHENSAVKPKVPTWVPASNGGCGSYGLKNNPNNTTLPPCLILVDVNGDRKPSPSNVNCDNYTCGDKNFYKYPAPNDRKLSDIFAIMITEDRAVPFGVVSQKAMYQAQK